jgi:hypothetical protein
MTANWKIVLRRLVDCAAFRLQLSVWNLVNEELKRKIVYEVMGPDGVGLKGQTQFHVRGLKPKPNYWMMGSG